ncbi:aspartate-alanine antiporter [Streptomyces sp. NBC_00264]|uniref:aspartate-alanine antiporter n=1 Tax=unclassified Streptomyces TaxID=2593676 RepID=UPI000F5C131A|nr:MULTISPECIES: aspartate-alanine antiporter [unclassified Streptomyces]WSW99903.1 aspartate-alanine antiporter [Streptomyces sp. NBC_00987]MCX5098973.1 aspartate-alanine antiporter [Streptomyces sp. NBC_00439]MCX5158510.1 aspartate-alanine antiporter [Streptomyces sp. NBC_00305]MCX5217033.1 aspartate-alanine antiporter [Streptomyces sp. NBC_00264]RPK69678.1 Aspartate/alanine antiporter [Streptomyces sp. ADI95-17]
MGVLKDHPELVLFASLALGHLLGKLRVGPLTLGGICGTLIVSLLLGAWTKAQVSDDVKTVFFALFIFALGYMAGPQFFRNLNKKSLRFFVLCGIELVCALGIAFGLAKGFDLDVGTASGILAGAATESAVVGTATESIGKLSGLTAQQVSEYQGNVATAYTVCYLFGLITIVLYTSQIMPMMLRINLRDAARELWERTRSSGTLEPDERPALPTMVGRTYLVTTADGRTVGNLESALDERITIESVKRGSKVLTPSPDLRLTLSDLVLVVGRRAQTIEAGRLIGPETPGVPGLDSPLATEQVSITRKSNDGKTIDRIQRENPEFLSAGVYVTDVTRTGQELPANGDTVVHRGDVLTLVGARSGLNKLVAKLGSVVRNDATDFIYLGLGIAAGSLLGQVVVKFGDVPLSLGTGGGCLVSGLLFGWFRSRSQTFGAFPPQAAATIKDMGLAVFIACTGLVSGPQAWPLLKEYGALLPFAGIAMVLIPATISLVVGLKLLRIEKPLLIGAIAGQQCSTPAITAVTQVAQSSVPMLGYTITYALSNFLLPLTGPVLVGILGS